MAPRRAFHVKIVSAPRPAPILVLVLSAWLGPVGCADPVTTAGWLGLDVQLGYEPGEALWPAPRPTPQERDIYFDLIGDLGVPRIRDRYMNWARIQPAPDGPYDFTDADDLIRRAQAARLDVLVVFRGVPAWAAAGGGDVSSRLPSRDHAESFVGFVRAFVRRYDGDGVADMPGLRRPIRAFEFMQDIDAFPLDEYAYWLKLFYETVKGTDPKAIVVLGSLRTPGLKTYDRPEGDYETCFERLLREPGLSGASFPCFDVVGFQQFPALHPGRSAFDQSVSYLRVTMAQNGLDLPIWLTAYGYDSEAKEEGRQAANIVKWALRARALGIDRAYLHCLWDYRVPGQPGPGRNLGLVREVEAGEVPSRKPAYEAFRTVLREVDARPRVAQRGEGLYVLTGQGEPRYAIWKEESYDPTSTLIPGWWQVRTLSGRTSTRQGTEIRLTATPLFIERVPSPFIH